jgi:hypothetical protein
VREFVNSLSIPRDSSRFPHKSYRFVRELERKNFSLEKFSSPFMNCIEALVNSSLESCPELTRSFPNQTSSPCAGRASPNTSPVSQANKNTFSSLRFLKKPTTGKQKRRRGAL